MPKSKMPQEICDLYLTNPSPNRPTISDLAKKYDLDTKKITKFFQNKRAADKRKQKPISQTYEKPESVASSIPVEPQPVAPVVPVFQVVPVLPEMIACEGCALGLENQEGHFGGCIPNPYLPHPYCEGCELNIPNQEAHYGGCLSEPPCMEVEEDKEEKFCLGCALGLEETGHYGGCVPLQECSQDPMLMDCEVAFLDADQIEAFFNTHCTVSN